jgi:hypothetical protein
MPEPNDEPVRPTQRCLTDLNLTFPPLEQQLHRLDHPVVSRAQKIPSEVADHGAERIVAINDLVWLKVKASNYRAAAHKIEAATEPRPEIVAGRAWWWIGAAGTRKADSAADDFYARLSAECGRAGKGTGGMSSAHLLPGSEDFKRLQAELAVAAVESIKNLVCTLVANSIRDGKVWSAQMARYEISVLIRARDGDAYIAVVAEGFVDPNFLAVILASVPGVDAADWLSEPSGAMGIQPSFGQIVRSAIIPPEYQSKIVDQYGTAAD